MLTNSDGTLALASFDEIDTRNRWLLYPAASGSSYFSSFLRERRPQCLDKIVALSDMDPNKWGLTQEGRRVVPPDEIARLDVDAVIVTSPMYFNAMRDQLRGAGHTEQLIVLADCIDAYMAWEAEKSMLAGKFADRDASGLDLSRFSTFFQALPFSRDTYPRSAKGALTYRLLEQARFPESFEGKSVLDLGASDCFYAFEAMARGAGGVTALDSFYWQDGDGLEKLEFAKEYFGCGLSHRVYDVNEIDVREVGRHDVVLCLGLYYHLRDPFRFFRAVRPVVGEKLIVTGRTVDMLILDPIAPGVKSASYLAMSDKNFGKWTANVPCLIDMLKLAGFETIDVVFNFCPEGSTIASTALHAS